MVLVFFVVNLLRIDLYDVVKEIKKGRDTMKTIIKRSILDYLKNPVLWIGLIIIVASMYQCLSSYLQIHYIKQNEQITQNDVALEDADVMDGYIPTSDDKERRREWEDTIKGTLMDTSKNGFGFSRQEADHVMKEIQNMDVKTASEFLESQYGYYNAIYAYEDLDGILYNEGNYEKIQKKIGYLPQEIDLYPNLTVKECLVYMGGLSGVARNDLEQRITYYLEKTSLTEHQNKKMRQLSGGMKRRVGLIQALLNNPDFLIIDEPTTGLDPEERIRIRNLLVDFSKDRTVLFSTHVVEDLAATCTQLAIMKKGSFLYSGSVSGLLENAKGCVWNCTVQNAEEARLLEANYSISSKQYVENGIHMKVLSKGKPNENCVLDNDITLEDAYIYLTNS